MIQKYSAQFVISERKVLLRVFDVVWVLFTVYLVGIFFQLEYFKINSQFWNWGFLLAIYLSIFSSIFELYDLQKASQFPTVLKNVILTTSVTVLFFLLTPIFTPVLPEKRIQIIYFYLAIISALLIWRYAYISFISSPRFYKRVLIIGDVLNVELIAKQLQKSDPNYSVIGFIDTHQLESQEKGNLLKSTLERFSSEDLSAIIQKNEINEILISNYKSEATIQPIYEQLFELLKQGFPVKDCSQVYEEKTQRIPVQHIQSDFYKFFHISQSNKNKNYIFFQRGADIFLSIFGMMIGLALIPFILVGNRIGNRGRLFYWQERVGKNGKSFKIVKFRSMKCNSEPNGAQWTLKDDVRITKFGKFLRRSRLDEFPQFYNIFKGEMSVIGPRPERPEFVKELSEMIPFFDTRHVIKPGLTGWAQVMTEYGDSHADSLEKLQYDLFYIKHRNLFMDINILTRTLSTVIYFRGQ